MAIPAEAVHSIKDQSSFLRFLRDNLAWPIDESISFENLTYDWFPSDLALTPEDLRGSKIFQLRPFTQYQPWGIFILQLSSSRLYMSELRRLLRNLVPRQRVVQSHPTWKLAHLLFICTNDWKSYTFAHFEGDKPERAKLSTFGWDFQSGYIRTLCQFNIPALKYPEQENLFGVDPRPWIQLWSSAFDVKPVTKRFYQEYDRVFRSIKVHLAKQFGLPKSLWNKDNPVEGWTRRQIEQDRKLHLFVQNLVNRLMFLKFLEKRRWLDFNPNYLFELYQRAVTRGENFYQKYLFYVFFAGLNRQVDLFVLHKEQIVASAQPLHESIGVLPFLNGGLFEKDIQDETVEIPNEAFQELFELFNGYNFTIMEDTPFDVEVAVNPEMLGKVFEESVISRKEKGAYYTPRNIVSFMCREGLKNYLRTHCSIENNEEKVQVLVDEHSAELLAEHDSLEIYKGLYSIRVLDPAVGSGAFIVGMMHEILEVYRAIGQKLAEDHPFIVQNKLANPREVYQLKKQIIQNNLYGVDIEDFAVNIARLRFWLSLAVDFPIDFGDRNDFIGNVNKIEPLPNLLYKVRQGDSLLAVYHGVSLEPHGRITSGEFASGRKQRIQTPLTEIIQLKKDFFGERNSGRKKQIQSRIEFSLRKVVANEIDVEIAALRASLAQLGLFEVTKKEKEAAKEILQEIQRLQDVKADLLASEGLPIGFAHIWDVEFGEVLGEGGFDVVICNPPWVRQEELKDIKDELSQHYECYTGTADLYVYFYEKALNLLKAGGTLSFISSNKFFRAGYGRNLREYLLQKTQLNSIIDFSDTPVFEATTYPTVVIATTDGRPPTTPAGENAIRARTVESEEELDHFEETFRAKAILVRQIDLAAEGWRIEDRRALNLLAKIKKAGVLLQEYVGGEIYRGITTGFNDAFVIDEETRTRLLREDKRSADLIKPVLRGRDIKRYQIEEPGIWLIFTRRGIEIARYRAIEKYLRQFKDRLTPGIEGGRKAGSYKWYEIQDSIDYWQEFEKPKIVSAVLMIEPLFAYDDAEHYTLDTCYIIPGGSHYLSAILNSKIGWWSLRRLTNQMQNQYSKIQISQLSKLSVPQASEIQERVIGGLVRLVLHLRRTDTKQLNQRVPNAHIASFFEAIIDSCVFELYFGDLMRERRLDVLNLLARTSIVESSGKAAVLNRAILEYYEEWRQSDSEIFNRVELLKSRGGDELLPIIRGTIG